MADPRAAAEVSLAGRLAEDLDGNFETLVRAYEDRLFTFALRVTGRREDAEEVAQDAFVRAYRALKTYPGERIRALAVKAWLYRITLNLARNRFRRKRAAVVSLDDERNSLATRGVPDDPAGRPDARLETKRRRADIASLVAALPDRYRAPLVLRYVEGLRIEEVADVLDQPVGTIKSHVHRAINALREALTDSRRRGARP